MRKKVHVSSKAKKIHLAPPLEMYLRMRSAHALPFCLDSVLGAGYTRGPKPGTHRDPRLYTMIDCSAERCNNRFKGFNFELCFVKEFKKKREKYMC